ncbi:hypothetical protein V6248_12190 [Pseudoalteromonas agarivorans]|uniref:hypothetical protein n=1 Tax=Pseudoalteromonas agarivorans TaxID=176102 RepID=UPI00311FE5A4
MRINDSLETLLGGAFGLTNLPFDVGRISGEATSSDKNDEFTRNNPTYRVSNNTRINCAIEDNKIVVPRKPLNTQF